MPEPHLRSRCDVPELLAAQLISPCLHTRFCRMGPQAIEWPAFCARI